YPSPSQRYLTINIKRFNTNQRDISKKKEKKEIIH
ncbi:unnamed protein product, partial [Brassica rapa subsp. narinosa]